MLVLTGFQIYPNAGVHPDRLRHYLFLLGCLVSGYSFFVASFYHLFCLLLVSTAGTPLYGPSLIPTVLEY